MYNFSKDTNATPLEYMMEDNNNKPSVYEPEPYPLKPIYSPIKTQGSTVSEKSGQLPLIKKQDFDTIATINLDNGRNVVVSRLNETNLWFNEKISTKSFSGFTYKGFGLKIHDLGIFRQTLSTMINNPYQEEVRIKLNSITDLVIYHPTLDTIDIRQYVTSEGYTGFMRKGIRFMFNEAEIFLNGIDNIDIQGV